MRRAAAEAAVSDMLKWFREDNGVVGIFDATNSTKSRRAWIHKRCEEAGIETLFVESLCDDEDIIMSNILEVKTTSPDYKGQDPEIAAQDFRNRIRHYETVYETISEDEKAYTYVKLINVGSTVIINQIKDYLSSRLVYYIQNLHIKPRSIWLSRVCSCYFLHHRFKTDILYSTESQSTIYPAKLAVIQIYHPEEKLMREHFPSS